MYLIPIAWIYVALMMAVAEATNSNGTVLGAIVTFTFYGLLPVALILYFISTPGRKRALRAREAALVAQAKSIEPDAGSEAPADPVASVGKEP
jgi:hypothetical protein